MEETADAPTIAKSITVLDVCHFISQSMNEIKSSTGSKCFQKTGFQNLTALRDEPDKQPPLDTLKEAVRHAEPEIPVEFSAEEYCSLIVDAIFEEISEKFTPRTSSSHLDFTIVDREECEIEEKSVITSTSVCHTWIHQLKLFFAEKGYTSMVDSMMMVEDNLSVRLVEQNKGNLTFNSSRPN